MDAQMPRNRASRSCSVQEKENGDQVRGARKGMGCRAIRHLARSLCAVPDGADGADEAQGTNQRRKPADRVAV